MSFSFHSNTLWNFPFDNLDPWLKSKHLPHRLTSSSSLYPCRAPSTACSSSLSFSASPASASPSSTLSITTAASSRFARFPSSTFRFETFPDGLPEDHPRSGDRILEIFNSVEAAAKPVLREILTNPDRRSTDNSSRKRATCVIADGFFDFVADVAEEIGVPLIYFDTISPCCLWVYLSLPNLIHAGELPFNSDDDLDKPIRSVLGMEGYLRRRDLPSFCRSGDLAEPILQLILAEDVQIPRARGLILNTFEELESPEILCHMRTVNPNLYAIGPLHSLLNTKLKHALPSSNSLWEEDRSCIAWLDAQPPRSVVYISIGSLAVMTSVQAVEIWHGIVNSGHRFLWARRPGSVIHGGEELAEEELEEGTKKRGYIVPWAPQEEVLCHVAVGAFLTHSGWNSTVESMVAGVPMICWPYFVDQQVNSRHVSQVWRLGVDMKDTCDRVTVERMVRDLMEVRREEFLQSAQQTARLAQESVRPGGTSNSNLDRLIKDIRLMDNNQE